MTLCNLYDMLADEGVGVYDRRLHDTRAVVISLSDRVGMFIDSKKLGSVVEEIEVVAHEAGHIMTGSLHKVYSPYDLIERHEYRANMWAFQQLVPVDKLVRLYLKGYRESGEYADALEVSEAFLVDALQYYHDTYGYNYQFGGYTVNFLPFSVQ